jgi:hypothetical protein
VSTRWRVRQASDGTNGERPRSGVRVNPAFRPVEIAWRTAGSVAANHDRPAPQRSFDALMPASHHQPAQSVSILDAPASESKRPAVLQMSDLDATVVDRLTDDVIRRVERRVRIERERRGM